MLKISNQAEINVLNPFSEYINCEINESINTTKLMIIGTDNTNNNEIDEIWYDLTSRLRPR